MSNQSRIALLTDVGRGLAGVVLVVELAGEDGAGRGGNPEVGRAGVKDNLEGLAGGADGDGAVVLGIKVVVDGDVRTVGQSSVPCESVSIEWRFRTCKRTLP